MHINTTYYALAASFLVVFTFVMPQELLAQTAPGGFVSCQGTTCSACDLVVMANKIIQWLMGIIAILFAILAAIAGWGLVTSAGSSGAKEDAKKKFINAFIGFIIVLAAWLLVDTVLLGLTGTGASTWTDVKCGTQAQAAINTSPLFTAANALAGTNGWSALQGNAITATCPMIPTPSGAQPNCTQYIQQCTSAGLSHTVSGSGSNTQVTCVAAPNSGGGGSTSGGRGTAQCSASNTNCSISTLQALGLTSAQANVMSCIAITENSGNAVGCSGTGPCGTFQISQTNWNTYSANIPGCSASNFGGNISAAQNNAACNAAVMAAMVAASGYQPWTGCCNSAGLPWNPAARTCVQNYSINDPTNPGFTFP